MRTALEQEIGRDLPKDTIGGITLAWNGRSEAEVDAAFAQAVRAGAKPIKAPVKAYWGGYSSYVEIPGGHLMEIAYNPFWPIDADGNIFDPELGFRLITSRKRLPRGRGTTESFWRCGRSALRSCGTL